MSGVGLEAAAVLWSVGLSTKAHVSRGSRFWRLLCFKSVGLLFSPRVLLSAVAAAANVATASTPMGERRVTSRS